ncbi:MAG TPA: FHA domain-containing protein, partial [Acidobacteriota bacterium]|nr:FHA domain-containing protein [Acidobacteriota bacterium]
MTETILYPQLIAVTGPLRGATIQLSDEQTFLGRGTANQICIADPLLSRRHCVLTRVSSQEFVIEDGGSINGTYLNGCPIKKQTLKHGDWIGVGESFLLVVCTDQQDQRSTSSSVQLDDSQIATKAPIWLNPKEAVYLNLDRELTNLVQNQQLAHNLQTLLKFSQSLIASQNLPKLYQRIVGAAFEIVPAQRGVLLLLNSRTSELETAFAQEKGEVAPAQTINV